MHRQFNLMQSLARRAAIRNQQQVTKTRGNMMNGKSALISCLALLGACALSVEARSMHQQAARQEEQVSAVIPSPNQVFGDEEAVGDIQRRSSIVGPSAKLGEVQSLNEAQMVPIYVSPYARAERDTRLAFAMPSGNEEGREDSIPSVQFASQPAASSVEGKRDLKVAASYGHGHHGGHHGGYDNSGWLDMGAWTGGKGSFGWYADYPVGKKHGHY